MEVAGVRRPKDASRGVAEEVLRDKRTTGGGGARAGGGRGATRRKREKPEARRRNRSRHRCHRHWSR